MQLLTTFPARLMHFFKQNILLTITSCYCYTITIEAKNMKKSDGFSIFYDAPNWPNIPPWWTITSPQVAALLSITPETLHIKRATSAAPKSISASVIKPAQGQPVFFRMGNVRTWVAAKLGVSYTITDQVTDFMMDWFANWQVCEFPLNEQVKHFDMVFGQQQQLFLRGQELEYFDGYLMLEWGDYYAKQPKFIGKKSKYWDLQYDLIITDVPRGYNSPYTPRQLAG